MWEEWSWGRFWSREDSSAHITGKWSMKIPVVLHSCIYCQKWSWGKRNPAHTDHSRLQIYFYLQTNPVLHFTLFFSWIITPTFIFHCTVIEAQNRSHKNHSQSIFWRACSKALKNNWTSCYHFVCITKSQCCFLFAVEEFFMTLWNVLLRDSTSQAL